MKKQKFTFLVENYQKARGDWSRFLYLYCAYGGHHVALFQKDGPGPLMRSYLHRILAPADLADLQNKKKVPEVHCRYYARLLGISDLYDEETRPAIFWLAYGLQQRVSAGVYPPRVEKINYKLPSLKMQFIVMSKPLLLVQYC